MANAVRNYKDSLFTHLFGHDPKLLVELYNVISGTDYPPDTPVEITTLEGGSLRRTQERHLLPAGRAVCGSGGASEHHQ